MLDTREISRQYQIPDPANFISDDFPRVGLAITAIGTDVKALQLSTTALSTSLANLSISGVSGLTAALAGKMSATTTFGLINLTDVNLTGQTDGQYLQRLGGVWKPSALGGLDAGVITTGRFLMAQMPLNLQSAYYPAGAWNASTNSPALASGTGAAGAVYRVSVAGSTNLDGNNQWNVGDHAVFISGAWEKWDGLPLEVTSVAGRTGAVVLTSADLTDATASGKTLLQAANAAALRVILNIDQVTLVADANQNIAASMEAVAFTSLTAPRTAQMCSAASMNNGQAMFVFDESGNCSTTNTITIPCAGTDTINGVTSCVLNSPYAAVMLLRGTAGKITAFPISGAIATATLLGAIKGGANLTLAADGTLSLTGANVKAALAFTPVQQGTGASQTSNTIKIGWDSGSSGIRLTVDESDFGLSWPMTARGNPKNDNGALAVGSYACLNGPNATTVGATIAGSSLTAYSVNSSINQTCSGTWRFMGTSLGTAYGNLYQRIA